MIAVIVIRSHRDEGMKLKCRNVRDLKEAIRKILGVGRQSRAISNLSCRRQSTSGTQASSPASLFAQKVGGTTSFLNAHCGSWFLSTLYTAGVLDKTELPP